MTAPRLQSQERFVPHDNDHRQDMPHGGWWARFLGAGVLVAFVMPFVPSPYNRYGAAVAAGLLTLSLVALGVATARRRR